MIVLATANPHKVEELRQILGAAGVEAIGLLDLRDARGGPIATTEPVESGTTFDANATIKALAYASQTGRACLADDSGLEVDALAGRPGVISSHYATDGREEGLSREARDRGNNARVLRELEGVPVERRGARFVCVMALALMGPDGPTLVHTARATFDGRIGLPGEVPRGRSGFGYDPLFLVAPDFVRTSAELDPGEKNRRSHRALAGQRMASWIAAHREVLHRALGVR